MPVGDMVNRSISVILLIVYGEEHEFIVVNRNDEYRAKYFNISKTNDCVKSILDFDVTYIFGSFVIIFMYRKRSSRIAKI